MTGSGLDEEGTLEAGVAAMSSILGMQGLPRDQAPVANLMTEMMKAMGSIACLSEVSNIPRWWAQYNLMLGETQLALIFSYPSTCRHQRDK